MTHRGEAKRTVFDWERQSLAAPLSVAGSAWFSAVMSVARHLRYRPAEVAHAMQRFEGSIAGMHERHHELGRFEFGEFELDLGAFELRSSGRAIAISRKAMAVLVYLIQHRERLVSREELMAQLWPDVHVGTGSISQAIWEIRKALRDESNDLIATRYGCGYRFAARVQPSDARGDSRWLALARQSY